MAGLDTHQSHTAVSPNEPINQEGCKRDEAQKVWKEWLADRDRIGREQAADEGRRKAWTRPQFSSE